MSSEPFQLDLAQGVAVLQQEQTVEDHFAHTRVLAAAYFSVDEFFHFGGQRNGHDVGSPPLKLCLCYKRGLGLCQSRLFNRYYVFASMVTIPPSTMSMVTR